MTVYTGPSDVLYDCERPRTMRDLPEELLQYIFDNLQVSGPVDFEDDHRLQRQTLAALCRVNKQFDRLAKPILFHTVHLGEYQIPIRPFWEVLVQNPHLSSLVRSLHIDDWEHPRIEHDFTRDQTAAEIDSLSSEVSETLQDAVKDMTAPLRSILGHMYDPVEGYQLVGIADGMLVYLIARCENLSCLELVVPHRFSTYTCVYPALRHMAQLQAAADATNNQTPVKSLSKLKELRMRHWDTENAFDISEAMPFWTFPSVNMFRGDMIDCTTAEGLAGAPALKENNIRELDLDNALIEADGLREILSRCPKLESLSIAWGSASVGDCVVNHQQLGQVLRDLPHLSKNLKKLIFDPTDAYDFEYSDDEYHEPLGCLTSFQSLEYLGLTPKGLIGEDDEDLDDYPNFAKVSLTEMLPESLRTFDVRGSHVQYTVEAHEKMRESMMPLDSQLYGLMNDARFQKLSTIKMNRLINEKETSVKDIGWKQVELKPKYMGHHDYALVRDGNQ
ncbi:hypothetical protein PRZ48_005183 [Zasmidium cellare]|uniref:F-box/LRR-repeat protein 15/At3g58940/PEG3-like LRR domain-containing protein n=1 Tax=Zasmidium cellare TaxID=395010 RepID=A0ABR0ERX0_ZASCE|nr:hypothetical protein PRZ48_005183 [Zasmidium cellare]